MKHPVPLLTLLTLAARIHTVEAQPRAPRSPPHVVHRGRGDWRASCVASVGCAPPRAVPRCSPEVRGAASLTFAQLIDQRFRRSGQPVAVRARLGSHGGACTEMACPPGACCNQCRGDVTLTGVAASSLRQVALGVADDPAFTCRGDDSGLCCGTAVPGGEVIVRGVLRPIADSGGAWRIESPTLCAAE